MNAFTANFNGHSLAANGLRDAELEMGGGGNLSVCACVCVHMGGRSSSLGNVEPSTGLIQDANEFQVMWKSASLRRPSKKKNKDTRRRRLCRRDAPEPHGSVPGSLAV